ncbi:MAG: thioredoxin family protein [Gemmatimonadales bacterium]|jgi:small redox-active disulfide protein 2
MLIQILGPGCANCERLAENARAAVARLNLTCEMVKVTDVNAIAEFGVLQTPALVVNGDVKVVGRVPDIDEIVTLLAS